MVTHKKFFSFFQKLYTLLPNPKVQISLKNSPSCQQLCSSIVSQLTSYIWDNQFINCTCPFCNTHNKDQLVLSCLQQNLLEFICQIDVLLHRRK